jgi:hypothetical protein
MTLEIKTITVSSRKNLELPIMLCKMSEQETKEYHLKKLYELSLKWREKNPREKPNEERDRKMKEIAWNGWRYY